MTMSMDAINPSIGRASIKGRVLGSVGWVLEQFRSPAKLKEFEYVDPISDQTIYLSTGARYSVLHVGMQQLFFDRVTGKFDGTCTSLEERIGDRLELLDK